MEKVKTTQREIESSSVARWTRPLVAPLQPAAAKCDGEKKADPFPAGIRQASLLSSVSAPLPVVANASPNGSHPADALICCFRELRAAPPTAATTKQKARMAASLAAKFSQLPACNAVHTTNLCFELGQFRTELDDVTEEAILAWIKRSLVTARTPGPVRVATVCNGVARLRRSMDPSLAAELARWVIDKLDPNVVARNYALAQLAQGLGQLQLPFDPLEQSRLQAWFLGGLQRANQEAESPASDKSARLNLVNLVDGLGQLFPGEQPPCLQEALGPWVRRYIDLEVPLPRSHFSRFVYGVGRLSPSFAAKDAAAYGAWLLANLRGCERPSTLDLRLILGGLARLRLDWTQPQRKALRGYAVYALASPLTPSLTCVSEVVWALGQLQLNLGATPQSALESWLQASLATTAEDPGGPGDASVWGLLLSGLVKLHGRPSQASFCALSGSLAAFLATSPLSGACCPSLDLTTVHFYEGAVALLSGGMALPLELDVQRALRDWGLQLLQHSGRHCPTPLLYRALVALGRGAEEPRTTAVHKAVRGWLESELPLPPAEEWPRHLLSMARALRFFAAEQGTAPAWFAAAEACRPAIEAVRGAAEVPSAWEVRVGEAVQSLVADSCCPTAQLRLQEPYGDLCIDLTLQQGERRLAIECHGDSYHRTSEEMRDHALLGHYDGVVKVWYSAWEQAQEALPAAAAASIYAWLAAVAPPPVPEDEEADSPPPPCVVAPVARAAARARRRRAKRRPPWRAQANSPRLPAASQCVVFTPSSVQACCLGACLTFGLGAASLCLLALHLAGQCGAGAEGVG